MARDIGQQAVDFTYRRLKIDPEWSIHEEMGFSWWAWKLAQRDIRIRGGEEPTPA